MQRILEFIRYPSHSRTLGLLAFLVVLLSIPLTVNIAQKQQELRQRAAGATPCEQNGGPGAACVGTTCYVHNIKCVFEEYTHGGNCNPTGAITCPVIQDDQSFYQKPVDCVESSSLSCTPAAPPTAAPTAPPTAQPPATIAPTAAPASTIVPSASPAVALPITGGGSSSCQYTCGCSNPQGGPAPGHIAVCPNVYGSGACYSDSGSGFTDCACPVAGGDATTPYANATGSLAGTFAWGGPCNFQDHKIYQIGNTCHYESCERFTGRYGNVSNGAFCWFSNDVKNTCQTTSTSPSPSGSPTTTTAPTATPSPTASPTAAPTPTAPPAGSTVLSFTNIALEGIGKDNGSLGGPHPPTSIGNPRSLSVDVLNSADNSTVTTISNGSLLYNSSTGTWTGTAAAPAATLPAGNYIFKLKTSNYVKRTYSVVTSVTAGGPNTLSSQVTLYPGELHGDTSIGLQDINIWRSCSIYSTDNGALCGQNSSYKGLSDLNQDGSVDQFDYNLLLREFRSNSTDQ